MRSIIFVQFQYNFAYIKIQYILIEDLGKILRIHRNYRETLRKKIVKYANLVYTEIHNLWIKIL